MIATKMSVTIYTKILENMIKILRNTVLTISFYSSFYIYNNMFKIRFYIYNRYINNEKFSMHENSFHRVINDKKFNNHLLANNFLFIIFHIIHSRFSTRFIVKNIIYNYSYIIV